MGKLLINGFSDGVTPLEKLTPSELAYVAGAITSYSPQMVSIFVDREFSAEFVVELDHSKLDFFGKLSEEDNSLLEYEYQEAAKSKFLYKRPYEIDEESAFECVTKRLLSKKNRELRVIEDFLSEAFIQAPSLQQLGYSIASVKPLGKGKPDFRLVFNKKQEIELSDLYIVNSQFFNSINHTILWWKTSWGNFDSPNDVRHDEKVRLKHWFAEAIEPEKRGLKTNFPLAEALTEFCWNENRFPTSRARDQGLLWNYFQEAGLEYGGKAIMRDTEASFIYHSDNGDNEAKVEMTKKDVLKSYKDTYYKYMLRAFGLSFTHSI